MYLLISPAVSRNIGRLYPYENRFLLLFMSNKLLKAVQLDGYYFLSKCECCCKEQPLLLTPSVADMISTTTESYNARVTPPTL